jgi:hypothetical protein
MVKREGICEVYDATHSQRVMPVEAHWIGHNRSRFDRFFTWTRGDDLHKS